MDNKLTIRDRFKNAINVFKRQEAETAATNHSYAMSYSYAGTINPDRRSRSSYIKGDKSIYNSVLTRIAIDVSEIDIRHVQLDEQGRFLYVRDSGLNNCLSLEANIDQTGRDFIKDAVLTLLDTGSVALVPIETLRNPNNTESYEILTMRVGVIKDWFPTKVRVSVWNELYGKKQEVVIDKTQVAILENPFYSVMNQPNSTFQRLIHKLNIMDAIDSRNGSDKLDLILQFPYAVKTEKKKEEAKKRIKQIEEQLSGTNYGIAYTDGTEKVVQLNRAVENNLMNQVEYLTNMLYSQLGISKEIFAGTATADQTNNYYRRTLDPIVNTIIDEIKRKFLTKTARTQGQSIVFFNDPFRLMPVEQIAEMADKLTRNEIMTSNEFRSKIGLQAFDDPRADELSNKNLNSMADYGGYDEYGDEEYYEEPE